MRLGARVLSNLRVGSVSIMALLALTLGVLPASVSAQSTPQVSYSVSSEQTNVRPGEVVYIDLTVNTQTELGGGSVNVVFENGSYVDFSSAGTSNFAFVNYHTNYNDVLFICNSNRCPIGSYLIGTITARADDSGTLRVSFAPKETANPQLQHISASGTTRTFTITPNALPTGSPSGGTNNGSSQPSTPSSGGTRRSGIVTIPQDDGNGGIIPIQIPTEQFAQRQQQAQRTATTPPVSDDITQTEQSSFWTIRNVLVFGLGGVLVLIALLLTLYRFLSRPNTPGPQPPYTPGGSGPTAIVG